MGVLGFLGLLGLGLGPAAAALHALSARPVLLLVAAAGAFLDVALLLLVSAATRWATPLSGLRSLPLAAIVIAAEELLRPALWRANRRFERGLEAASRRRLWRADRWALAAAWGLGLGLAHAAALFLGAAPLALGSAVLYAERCPQLPLLVVQALLCAGFTLVHAAGMPVAFAGLEAGDRKLRAFAPGVRLLCFLLAPLAAARGGCVAEAALALLAGLASAAFAYALLLRSAG